MIGTEAPRDLEAALVPKRDIDEYDIGPERPSLAQRVRACRGDPRDRQALSLKQLLGRLQESSIIVDDQAADGHAISVAGNRRRRIAGSRNPPRPGERASQAQRGSLGSSPSRRWHEARVGGPGFPADRGPAHPRCRVRVQRAAQIRADEVSETLLEPACRRSRFGRAGAAMPGDRVRVAGVRPLRSAPRPAGAEELDADAPRARPGSRCCRVQEVPVRPGAAPLAISTLGGGDRAVEVGGGDGGLELLDLVWRGGPVGREAVVSQPASSAPAS